jgi:hypothetical protein
MSHAPAPAFRRVITIFAIVLLALQAVLMSAPLASAAPAAEGGPPTGSHAYVPAGYTARSRPSPSAVPHASTAPKQTYLYTCFWQKQAVTLTPVKSARVDKLPDAKVAGSCARFDTADLRFKALVGKSLKVYRAPAEFKTALVAYKVRMGKSTAFGAWTFSQTSVIVKKTTDVLPASTVMDIKPSVAGQPLATTAPDLTLTFRASDPRVNALKLGSVIVSGVTPLTPYGMMRKVTAITVKPSQVAADTVPAQLSDVFNEATIDIHSTLTQAVRTALARHPDRLMHVNPLTDKLSICPTFPSLTVGSSGVQTGESSGGLGAVTLGGSVCLTAGDLHFQEYVSRVKPRFSWLFDGSDNLHVTYKLKGGVVAYSGTLATLLDEDLGLIPLEEFGVPVEIVPHISSKLSANLSLSGYVSGGFSYAGTYQAGLSCGVTGCLPTGNTNGGFSADKTLTGGTVSFTISLGIGISFLVDGVFGPGFGASVYATASAGTGETDCVSLVAGVKATLSLNFQLFGKFKWTGSWDVIKFEKPIPFDTPTCVPKIKSFMTDLPSPVEVGRKVTFTAVADRAVDQGGFHIAIIDALTNQPVQSDCTSGDTCKYDDTEASVKERILMAEITDSQGAILDTKGPVKMSWGSSSITISTSSPSQIPVGEKATLVVTAKDVHTAHWLINLFEDGAIINGCADMNQCSFMVSHTDAGQHTYTAQLEDGTDLKVIAQTGAGDAVKIKWTAAKLQLSATPDRHDFVLGTSATLTLKADPGVDGTTTFLKIVGSDSSTVAECNTGATCEGKATSSTVGTVTYTGEVVDNKGTVLDSITLALNWFRFQVTEALSGVSSSEVPVGKQVTFELNASPNVPGFTLSISAPGGTYKCPSLSNCTAVAKSNTAKQVTYSVQVTDDSTGNVASDVVTQQVTWVDFALDVSASPGTTVPAGTKVTITVSATPADPDYTMTISGGGGSYTCPSLTACASDVRTSTPQSVTYTIEVKDKATLTTLASRQITINWQGTSPCPGGALACLLLNPSSGDPNSSFVATWYDANAPNASATFSFDGSAFSGSTVQMDASGTGSLTITLHGSAAGPHTVGVQDSAGGHGSNTYTVTGGGGGGACSGVSVSMTADNANPSAGSSATLSVTSGQSLPSGCQVKIEDPGNGYVYNTCSGNDTTTNFCYVQVPYTDAFGSTGCPNQGVAGQSCSYRAYVLPTGDSNRADATSSSGVVTITWH